MIPGHCGSSICVEDCRYCKYGIGAVDDDEYYASYLERLEAEWEKQVDEELKKSQKLKGGQK